MSTQIRQEILDPSLPPKPMLSVEISMSESLPTTANQLRDLPATVGFKYIQHQPTVCPNLDDEEIAYTLDVRKALTKNLVLDLLGGEHDGSAFTVLIIRINNKETTEGEIGNAKLDGDLTFTDGVNLGYANVSDEVKKMLQPFGGNLKAWTVIDVLEYRAKLYPDSKLFVGRKPVTFTKIRKAFLDPDIENSDTFLLKRDFLKGINKLDYFNKKYVEKFVGGKCCICPLDETCLLRGIFGHLRFNSGFRVVQDDIRVYLGVETILILDANRASLGIPEEKPIKVKWTKKKAALISQLLHDSRAKHNCNPLELRHFWEMRSTNTSSSFNFLRIVVERTRDEKLLRQLYPVIQKELDESAMADIKVYALENFGFYREPEMVRFLKELNVKLVTEDAFTFFGGIQQFDDYRYVKTFENEGFNLDPNDQRFDLMHSMAQKHFRQCLRYLLYRGFDIERRNENGLTPFMAVVLSDELRRVPSTEFSLERLEFLEYMISRGADPLALRSEKTCLQIAFEEQKEHSLDYLLNLGFVVVRSSKGKKDEFVDVREKFAKRRLRSLLKDEKIYYWPDICDQCSSPCPADHDLCIWCKKEERKKSTVENPEIVEELQSATTSTLDAESKTQPFSTNSTKESSVDDALLSTPKTVSCKFEFCSQNQRVLSTKDKNYFEAFCQDKCRVIFHGSCWNEFKGRKTTKNFLGADCMTPDCPSKIYAVKVMDFEGNVKAQYSKEKLEPKAKRNIDKKQKRKTVDLISEAKENQNPESKQKSKSQIKKMDQNMNESDDPTSMQIDNRVLSAEIQSENLAEIRPEPKLSHDLIHLEEEFLTKLEKKDEEETNRIKSSKKKKKKRNLRKIPLRFKLFADSSRDNQSTGNQANDSAETSTLTAREETSQSATETELQSKEIAYLSVVEYLAKNGNRSFLETLRATIHDWDPPIRRSLLSAGLKEVLMSDAKRRFSLRLEGDSEVVYLRGEYRAENVEGDACFHDRGQRSMQETENQDCRKCASLENRCATLESRYSDLEKRFAALMKEESSKEENECSENEDRCCFCLEALLGKRVTSLPRCRHRYHYVCLRRYKGQACPLCRAPIQEEFPPLSLLR